MTESMKKRKKFNQAENNKSKKNRNQNRGANDG